MCHSDTRFQNTDFFKDAKMKTLSEFEKISGTMLWKNAALSQLESFKSLAGEIGSPEPIVVSSHVSKSITLPVALFSVPHLRIVIRDNFHGLNVWVESDRPITVPLSEIFPAIDFAWYKSQIDSCRGYTYADWSIDEINDDRILRVRRKNGNGWSMVSGDEKDRWSKRMTSTEWYKKDWSSSSLIVDEESVNRAKADIEFNENTQFFRCEHCFAEGMSSLWEKEPPLYSVGSQNFIIAIDDWASARKFLKIIMENVILRD